MASASRYYQTVGRALAMFSFDIQQEDIDTKPQEVDFFSMFDLVTDGIKSKTERANAEDRLYEFHQFLVERLSIRPLVWRGRTPRMESVGRTNLVTERDFEKILECVSALDLPPRERLRLQIVTILVYRLGLRRSEVVSLVLSDVLGFRWLPSYVSTDNLDLLVHANAIEGAKTDAAHRILPLVVLLSAEEYRLFCGWLKVRKEEVGGGHPKQLPLFGSRKREMDIPEIDRNLDLIQRITREILGDPFFVIHEYRHSAITLLSARLMALEVEAIGAEMGVEGVFGLIAPLPESCVSAQYFSSKDLTKRLLRSDDLPRAALHLVALIAGHADPRTTTQTYAHLYDWVSAALIHRFAPVVPDKVLARWNGKSPGTFAVDKHRRG